MVELFRRADPNGLLPLIERGWQVAFTNILELLTTQASVDDAVNFITTAHAVLGHGDVLKIHGCRAVDSAAAPIAVELAAPQHDKKTITERTRYAEQSMRARLSTGSGDLPGRGPMMSITGEDTDDKWRDAQKDTKLSEMIRELQALHTIPIPAAKCAAIMLKAPSPAGLIFLHSTRTPNIEILKDMTVARTPSAISDAPAFQPARRRERVRPLPRAAGALARARPGQPRHHTRRRPARHHGRRQLRSQMGRQVLPRRRDRLQATSNFARYRQASRAPHVRHAPLLLCEAHEPAVEKPLLSRRSHHHRRQTAKRSRPVLRVAAHPA